MRYPSQGEGFAMAHQTESIPRRSVLLSGAYALTFATGAQAAGSSEAERVGRVAEEYVRAYRAMDPQRMSRILAEDVQFEDPTFRLKHSSRAAVIKMMREAAAGFEDVGLDVSRRIIQPPHAVLEVAFRGRRRASSQGEVNAPIRVRGVTILRIEGDLIRQWTDYFDFRTFAEALEMPICKTGFIAQLRRRILGT